MFSSKHLTLCSYTNLDLNPKSHRLLNQIIRLWLLLELTDVSLTYRNMHHLICPGRPSAHIRTGQHPLRSYRYWFLMITKTVTTIRNQVSTGAVKQPTAIMFRQRAIFTKTRASL